MSPAAGPRPLVISAADKGSAEQLRRGLSTRPGWWAPDPPVDLLARFGRILWGYVSGDGSAGVSSLADRPEFLAAVRELRDRLIAEISEPGAGYFVDVIAEPERLGVLHDLLWGDALTVDCEKAIDEFGPPTDSSLPAAVSVDRLAAGSLIVVLGAARSGTTWLHRMLSAHPQVAGTETGETWLFPDIAPIWNDLATRVDRPQLATMLRDFCDRLLAAMRDRTKPAASHVSEKTPATVWRLPMLSAVYPDAHYVHVIRDGRDATLSMARSGGGRDDLRASAEAWVAAVTEVRASAPLFDHYREVRYEDLLADPVAVVGAIWQWMGLPVSDRAVEALAQRRDERVSPLTGVGPIGSGKWQTLPRSEQRVIEQVADTLLRELGYR